MAMSETLRDIRLFVAAYEERSFTAAGMRENATQSGVSQHIRKLEDRFGVQLFSRKGGSVTPTPAGDSYYRHCLDILRCHDRANKSLMPFRKGLDGDVVVGLMPTMTRCALAPSLARFLAEQPNVSLKIIEAYSGVLTQMVRSGELDFAVVPAFPIGPGLSSRSFLRTPEVLVSRPSGRWTNLSPLRVENLPPLDLVLPGPQNTRRPALEAHVLAHGGKIARILELDAMLGTLAFVANTDWLTILPGVLMATAFTDTSFTVNPLVDPFLFLDLILIEPAGRVLSPSADAFRRVLHEETVRINAPWLARL